VILRRDHVAGGAMLAAAFFVYGVSGDLPWGSMAMPGAGMMPKLILALMGVFGLVLLAGAQRSPPFATVDWSDLPHAARVGVVTAAAIALYEPLGFIVTMSALLFALSGAVERRPLLYSAGFSIGVTVLAYGLFSTLLKSPLPRGVLGY
jgi:hypothetical protein